MFLLLLAHKKDWKFSVRVKSTLLYAIIWSAIPFVGGEAGKDLRKYYLLCQKRVKNEVADTIIICTTIAESSRESEDFLSSSVPTNESGLTIAWPCICWFCSAIDACSFERPSKYHFFGGNDASKTWGSRQGKVLLLLSTTEDSNWRRRRRRKGWMKRSENNGQQPRLVQRMPP